MVEIKWFDNEDCIDDWSGVLGAEEYRNDGNYLKLYPARLKTYTPDGRRVLAGAIRYKTWDPFSFRGVYHIVDMNEKPERPVLREKQEKVVLPEKKEKIKHVGRENKEKRELPKISEKEVESLRYPIKSTSKTVGRRQTENSRKRIDQ